MAHEAKGNPHDAFAWAIKTSDLARVKEFVEKDKMDVNIMMNGRTPLLMAADFGKLEILQYLVSKGAKVNVKDKHGITPLLAAVYENHADAVKFLLEKGADVNVKGPDGKTPKQAAEKEEVKKLFK